MKLTLTLELPENPDAETRVFDLPNGTWRFDEHLLNDGRCFTSIVFIHGEKKDMGELSQRLTSALEVESAIKHGTSKTTINLRGVKRLSIDTRAVETGRFSSSEPHEVRPPSTEKEILDSDNVVIKHNYEQSQVCDRPPEGWSCSRPKGHDGPCAAWPVSGRRDGG
jgi:hypothetical protein